MRRIKMSRARAPPTAPPIMDVFSGPRPPPSCPGTLLGSAEAVGFAVVAGEDFVLVEVGTALDDAELVLAV